MAQTNTTVGFKSNGSRVSAAEFNQINSAVNSNADDLEGRIAALGSTTTNARLDLVEDTDTSSVNGYHTDSLPSGKENGTIAYDLDSEIPVYSSASVWYRCSDNVSIITLPVMDLFLVMGQSNADGKADINNFTGTQSEDLSSTLCYVASVNQTTKDFVDGSWGAMNVGTNTATAGNRFGPEYGMADSAIAIRSTEPVMFARDAAFLKIVKGATDLAEDWSSTFSNNYMYTAMEKGLPNGKFGLGQFGRRFRIRAMVWYQGESDAGNLTFANNYQSNLTAFLTDIRTRVGISDLPIVLCKVDYDSSPPAYLSTVRAALQSVADNDSNIEIIDTQGLGRRDSVHLDADGMFLLGQQIITKLSSML